uniref:hypothetical protein n=1 Tax=Castellaniella defragrans TaxID=75697 RepID=UPI003342BD45
MFLHTALHSKAEWLVSGDKDLLELPPADWGFEILSPVQALENGAKNELRNSASTSTLR